MKIDPRKVQACGPWILVQEDPPPTQTSGGLIIPSTSKTKGRQHTKGTVLSVGDGRGKDGRYEMPTVGSRIAFAAIAGIPDTPTKQASMFRMEDLPDGAKCYMLHVIDVLFVIEEGPEPKVE